MSRLWTSIQLMLANAYDEVFAKPPPSLPPPPTTAPLEDRIREMLEEVGSDDAEVLDGTSPADQLEILFHILKCAQHNEAELRAKFEPTRKLNTEMLGRAMFEATNLRLGNAWERQDPLWQAEYVAEAGAAMSVVLVALCRIHKKRLQDLLIQSEGNLQLFLEAAFHEAVDTAQASPKLDA